MSKSPACKFWHLWLTDTSELVNTLKFFVNTSHLCETQSALEGRQLVDYAVNLTFVTSGLL